jgi:hypothetical protein
MFRLTRSSKLVSALLTAFIVLPPELLAIKLAAVKGSYGAFLFLGIPFSLGFVAVLLYAKLAGGGGEGGISVALLATLLCGLCLFVFGWEGIFCLVIAFIIAAPFTLLGAAVGLYFVRLRRNSSLAACLILLVPALAPQEHRWHSAEHFQVQTSIEIAAPPERVWPLVVSFPKIASPASGTLAWAGIAYPMETTIDGQGVGVTRRCVFTTGVAEEVVDVWDAPRRLRFTVLRQPPLMSETSWVPDLKTEHIKSEYAQSRAGQFDLIALPNGHTLLRGTSWYDLQYWPSSYWHLWTDAMVHRIHMRVLEHIKAEVERG